MAAHAGETAQETGDYFCAYCDEKVHAERGEQIPECPNGHRSFDTRRNEPGSAR
ncbi:MAG: hypothetical protein AVDCRST_MAG07-704 [uncultured Frankineae bacterium]|uniref:Alpha helical protein n=1 Tax=uncultured Frankineae bacterium TaxID=437475 RepID=A0A6J4KQY8_9ACTN|nr:MAG: hypothetical protein AVDCRST_MAG07-704 [uncultured Frankineae bacterium]